MKKEAVLFGFLLLFIESTFSVKSWCEEIKDKEEIRLPYTITVGNVNKELVLKIIHYLNKYTWNQTKTVLR